MFFPRFDKNRFCFTILFSKDLRNLGMKWKGDSKILCQITLQRIHCHLDRSLCRYAFLASLTFKVRRISSLLRINVINL